MTSPEVPRASNVPLENECGLIAKRSIANVFSWSKYNLLVSLRYFNDVGYHKEVHW